MNTKIEFLGLSPGLPPFGREKLFLVNGAVPATAAQLVRWGLKIPRSAMVAVERALHDWNNRGLCDDNLLRFR